jgi:hypothetical protein
VSIPPATLQGIFLCPVRKTSVKSTLSGEKQLILQSNLVLIKIYTGMSVSLLERLQLNGEKNLLIQGLPSSIEKHFVKLSFAKNVTPLLRTKKIDFALVFAVNQNQLNGILKEVLPSLCSNAKFWVAYPKTTSKIVSDLNRDGSWQFVCQCGFETSEEVELDHVWTAMRFEKAIALPSKPTRTNRASRLSPAEV